MDYRDKWAIIIIIIYNNYNKLNCDVQYFNLINNYNNLNCDLQYTNQIPTVEPETAITRPIAVYLIRTFQICDFFT